MIAMACSALVLVLAAMRIMVRRRCPNSVDSVLIGIGVGLLFMARTVNTGIDHATLSIDLRVAPDVAPIVDVSGVLVRIQGDPSSVDRGSDQAWDPIRGIIRVTDADDRSWIDAFMSIRFDRPGGLELPGAKIRVRGRLHAHRVSSNPGVEPRLRGSRRVSATLVVPHAGLVEPLESTEIDVARWIPLVRAGWWASIRRLEGHVSEAGESVTTGLFTALLTGDRRHLDIDFVMAARRSGLSHLLAISGLHLAVIGMLVGGGVSILLSRPSRLRHAIPIMVVSMFGMLVIPGPSVQRAVLMAVTFGGFQAMGRDVRARPLVVLALMVMCWWDPTWPGSVGFQLTSVATIAIVFAVPAFRSRWFGPGDRIGSQRRSLFRDRFSMAASAGIVAWSATLPVVIANFGTASMVSVPATMVASLLLIPILGLGFLGGMLESFLPGWSIGPVSEMIAFPLGMFSHFVREVGVLAPSISTTTTALGIIVSVPMSLAVIWILGSPPGRMRWVWTIGLVLVAFSCFGWRNSSVSPRVRMIDVIDGSAIVVRSGRSAFLYDSGSSSISNPGSRLIIPTLRRIGVRRLDGIVVSHANSDHFNAVAEIIAEMPVDRLITTESFLDVARSGSRPDLAEILEKVHAFGIPVDTAGRGDRFHFGRLGCRVIHPNRGDSYRFINDSSLVIAVQIGPGDRGRFADLLLTGDIQDEGISKVLAQETGLEVSVLEIPHHGSWRPIAAEMIRALDPEVIIQSTGPRRWRHDRFGDACAGRRRHVTARDGSFVVELPVD